MSALRFGSVCSGIEAASVAFGDIGWEAAWFSEIDKFPSSVLAHRFPDIANLGDMTTLPSRIAAGEVEAPDVLCGGTPCQSWSLAGARKGSEDARGQLTFKFVEIIKEARPKFVLWENVPGIISAEGGIAFCQLLDEITSLGYLINTDILDAQNFGMAQRRRRVFLVCQRADTLMVKRTSTSALTGATMFAQLLQNILEGLLEGYSSVPGSSGCLSRSAVDGLQRKTRPFSTQKEELLQTWLLSCSDAFLSAATEQGLLGSHLGLGIETEELSPVSGATPSLGLPEPEGERPQRQYLSTSLSLRRCLEDLFNVARWSTTSTQLKEITDQKIYLYAEMLNIIGMFTARSIGSCPNSWEAASSYLTAQQKLTEYARHSNKKIPKGTRVYGCWDAISRQAESTAAFVKSSELLASSEILFELEGVVGDCPQVDSQEAEARTTCPSSGSAKELSGCWWDGGQLSQTLDAVLYKKQTLPEKSRFPAVWDGGRLRFITPLEAERLQGFPDDWTDVPGASDSTRYKAIGNSWPIHVVRWIGKRIDEAVR